jgi:acetyl esterase/lipase
MKSILATIFLYTLMCSTTAIAATVNDIGTFEVIEQDFVYARAGGVELLAHSYRPRKEGVVPAIIDIHGGAWSTGDRMGGKLYDQALASAGLYVLAIDFRQAPEFQHPAASQDIVAAIHYLHSHSEPLRIDTTRLGLVGSSSGGHLAMLTGIMPNAKQFAGTSIVTTKGTSENASDAIEAIRYVIALWPVSDPAYRYDYAKRSGREDLIKAHDAYFGTRERMVSASVPGVIRANEAEHLPALMVVQPGKDANIPREMTFDLLSAYQDGGGRVNYAFYPEQPHAFGHRPSAASRDLVRVMRDFVAGCLAEIQND